MTDALQLAHVLPSTAALRTTATEDDADVVVILYYLYVDIPSAELTHVQSELHALCTSLSLLGRIRLASEGINGSNSGSASAIAAFIEAMSTTSPTLSPYFATIRYKHSTCPASAPPPFSSLAINLTAELTSTGSMCSYHPRAHPTAHLSPAEFHARLLRPPPGQLVVDVRNYYESTIGRFPCAHDPRIRSFSQLSTWVEQNLPTLRGRSVLLYCTGGVRCEKAAAYMKARGVDDVAQLDGGIHAYLAAFHTEGLFEGRMTVFDARGAVDGGRQTVGRCVTCAALWDRHCEERRCALCRCLVLTCDGCAEAADGPLLCEEHILMDDAHGRAAAFLVRFSLHELEDMRRVLELCELWANDKRQGKSRRHRNRRRQLQLQRRRIDQEIAARGVPTKSEHDAEAQRIHGGSDEEDEQLQQFDGVSPIFPSETAADVHNCKKRTRREVEEKRRALAREDTLLPYMPALNSMPMLNL